MQFGIKNEKDFAYYFNNKKICNLPINGQELIYKIFNEVDSESYIESWISKYFEKADIKIKINGIVKGISIKTGQNCSMHQESIKTFDKFLLSIGVEEKIISIFNNYIIGRINDEKVDAKTYINNYPNDIASINNSFNSYYIKINLLMRFLFHGTEIQLYDCDAIIYGMPNNYVWATKDEITRYLFECSHRYENAISVSLLTIKCYDRNLRCNPVRKSKENDIQVKWLSLPRDITYLSKLREANKIKNSNTLKDYIKK